MTRTLSIALALALLGCLGQEGNPEIASTTSALSSIKIDPMLAKSTSGPTPPKSVTDRDAKRRAAAAAARSATAAGAETVIAGVPAYLWRHGCGPTAAGMVVGYYDAHGYSLIDGDASTQTAAVDQAIASGGTWSAPFPPGSEQHFEDYAMPRDDGDVAVTTDAYITANRTPHANNSIADYMSTSMSGFSMHYGWSLDALLETGLVGYAGQKAPSVTVQAATAYAGDNLTWQLVTQEINNNRPMVFLVDYDADGGTDHFVTVIGYRETPTRQYGCLDTWSSTIRWEDFLPIAYGQPWGIYSAHTFRLSGGAPQCSTNAQCDDGLACTIDTCVSGACQHDSSTCGCTSNAQCDDGRFCNGQETCVAGGCVAGTSWGAPCEQATLVSRNQGSGNFNTSGEKWFYTTESINGWWSSSMDGRTIRVNGTIVTPNSMPLPDMINGVRYFQFTAGTHPWASWGFW